MSAVAHGYQLWRFGSHFGYFHASRQRALARARCMTSAGVVALLRLLSPSRSTDAWLGASVQYRSMLTAWVLLAWQYACDGYRCQLTLYPTRNLRVYACGRGLVLAAKTLLAWLLLAWQLVQWLSPPHPTNARLVSLRVHHWSKPVACCCLRHSTPAMALPSRTTLGRQLHQHAV